MKQYSHSRLGRYLIEELLSERTKRRYRAAFLLGCVEPDRNPFTYLKGSLRSKMLYGHNYQNADRWIDRAIRKLARKEDWRVWDYYRMGKLIHYSADAFTYVHNNCFTDTIHAHREYEAALQARLLPRLETGGVPETGELELARFREIHDGYLRHKASVANDCRYILSMTAFLFLSLWPGNVPARAARN